jgi:hypothetical protein
MSIASSQRRRDNPMSARTIFADHNGLSRIRHMRPFTSRRVYTLCYNFRLCASPSVTHAMEARLSDHVWAVEEIIALLGQSREPARVC